MTCKFRSGFETNNFDETEWLNGGSSSIVTSATTTPHSGTYSCRCPAANAGPRKDLQTGLTSGTAFYRIYFKMETVGTADRTLLLVRSTGGTTCAEVRWDSATSTWFLFRNIGTVDTVQTTETFETALWYRMELRHLIHDSVGELELRFFVGNETTIYSTVSTPTGDTLPGSVQRFEFAVGATNGPIIILDDIGFNTSVDDGDGQNSWCGPGNIAYKEPVAVFQAEWEDTDTGAPGAGNTNATRVADPPGTPDTTTYVTTDTEGSQHDKYSSSNLPAEVPSNAVMKVMSVQARIGSNQTVSNPGRLYAQYAPDEYFGPDMQFNVNGWKQTNTNENLIVNLTGRTKQNVNDFTLGLENKNSVGDGSGLLKRVTALWANVEWVEQSAVDITPNVGSEVLTGVAPALLRGTYITPVTP